MKEDWIKIKLGKVCNYSKGKKPKVLAKKYSEATPYPYVNIKAFEKGIFEEYTNGEKCNLCEEGDLLMVWDGARAGLTGKAQKGAIGSTLMRIEPQKGVVKNYLFYYLLSLYKKLNTNPRGVGIPHVEPSLLWDSYFLLPPLPIQRAIVTKIENLFASFDKGIADLKKAQEQLKVYRQAVLKKAFEGEFATHKLGEIAVVSRGKSKHRPRNDKSLFGGKYPFIQTGEIRTANGGIIKKYSNTYSEKGLAQSKLWPKGTLCLTIAANIGETAFLGFDSCFPDSVVGVKPNNEVLSDEFLNFYIRKIKKDIDNKASATAQKNINVRFLNALKIPLPSLEEQKDIVREIESRLSICDKVEQSITEGLQKSEALRQSILKKAFEGKLLSEAEIEKCKQESDYEPASVLLEKIKKTKHDK
ncbi:MAG: restriction endonuclease subunit S [candidate division KSB1 bacterium]|nr:restriction endonuclease subunit S [candidate division KSB1 bacterium]